ncbi:MAG: helicase-related protein [archaeon]
MVKFVEHRLIKKNKIESRLYQEELLCSILDKNSLVVLPTGLGKCHAPEDVVLLGNGGLKAIGDIFHESEGEKFKINSIGGEVKLYGDATVYSLNDWHIKSKGVTGCCRLKSNSLLKIVTESGAEVTVTPEHPLLTIADGQTYWKSAKNLGVSDHVAVPLKIEIGGTETKIDFFRLFPSKLVNCSFYCVLKDANRKKTYRIDDARERNLPDDLVKENLRGVFVSGGRMNLKVLRPVWRLTPDLAWLVGMIIAEGRMAGSIDFFNKDKVILRKFDRLSKKIFGVRAERIKGGLCLRCSALVYFLKYQFGMQSGSHSREKKVPECVLSAPDNVVSAFLRAMYDGEGNIRGDGTIELTSASEQLISQMCYLLLRFGLRARVKKKVAWASNSLAPKKRQYYVMRISGRTSLKRFESNIGFEIEEKKKRLRAIMDDGKKENTNTDVIPVSKKIRGIREKLLLKTTAYKDFPLPTIDIYERGEKRPSRGVARCIFSVFEERISEMEKLGEDVKFLERELVKSRGGSVISHPRTIETLERVRHRLRVSKWNLRKSEIYWTPNPKTEKLVRMIEFVLNVYGRAVDCRKEVEDLKNLVEAPILWDPIKSIERAKSEHVYDLIINNGQNFIAGKNGGLFSHNTSLALLLITYIIEKNPDKKILFLAPTKPLADQHKRYFEDVMDVDGMFLLTGKTNPAERKEVWSRGKVFFATPQVVENDILTGRLSMDEFSLVVFDEAHRAVGDYAYVFIAKETNGLILALTASPGGDQETIEAVCRNLRIRHVEIRTEKDDGVKQYVKGSDVIWEEVELPESFMRIKKSLEESLKPYLVFLRDEGYLKSAQLAKVRKRDLLMLQGRIRGRISRGEKTAFAAASKVASVIKAYHALELLETQGISATHSYLGRLKEGKSRAVASLFSNERFMDAVIRTKSLHEAGVEHPKMARLKMIVSRELSANPRSLIIVFTQYRDSVKKIIEELKKNGVKAERLIGQAAKSEKGMSQKEQVHTLERFKKGEFSVLVASSVAEEGLDIGGCDCVVFFEPVPSPLRTIQRRGRTARFRAGKVVVLVAKGTRDEGYYWSSFHRERKMKKVLGEMQKKEIGVKQKRLVDY